jgi:glycosyltransferase involved in cell wall biosynthesis
MTGERQMKIAYIINSVEGGGAAFPVPSIAKALRDCGADIEVFALTRRDGRALPAMIASGLDPTVRDGGETDHLRALAWLDRTVARFQPDIIWTSLTRATLLGQLVGARRRIPVVSWQHKEFLRPANRRLLRTMRRLSALWVADSSSVAAFTMKELHVPPAKLVTWPIFAGDASAPRSKPWQPGEVLRIASLGRLHEHKGYDVLIAALARLRSDGVPLPPFEITIAGSGSDHEQLLAMATKAGLTNLIFIGFVEDTRSFLANQHLYIQPSRSEGFCVAAHEAMQAGLPVLASRVGEMAHSILPGVTGALVPPGDPEALASALADCLANPADLYAMGVAGRERLFAKFGASQFRETAAEIYDRLQELRR